LYQQIVSPVEWLWSTGPIVAVQEFFGAGWGWLFYGLSFLGTIYAATVVISVAFWLGGRRLAYGLIGALLLATATDALLWAVVGVPRPDDPQVVVRAHLGVSSFPSGHTVTAAVLWGTLSAFGRMPWAVPALVVPGVMLSRLYLGAHYLGDVLGGALIGALLVAVWVRARPVVVRRLSRLPFWAFQIFGLCAPFAILAYMGLSPRGSELFAVALAAGIGLTLEYRYVRFEPAASPGGRRATKVGIGLGVMGPLILARGLLNEPVLAAVLLALAVLWGMLLAPALFARMRPGDRLRGGEALGVSRKQRSIAGHLSRRRDPSPVQGKKE